MNNHKKHTSPQAGFTLIELLMVMAISLIGMAGVMSVFTSNSRANVLSQQSSEAVEIAEESMEELRSMSIADIESLPGGPYPAITSAGWGPLPYHLGQVPGSKNVIFDRQVSAIQTAASTTLVRIQLVVTWEDSGRDPTDPNISAESIHRVTLETIRTRQGSL